MAGTTTPASTDPLPADMGFVATRVVARVTELVDAETQRWAEVDPDLAQPLEALRSLLLAGGKRLRPVFCHWGFVAAGGDREDPSLVDAGAAFELLQAFALIHDDATNAA